MYRTACICPSMIRFFLVNLAVRMGHTFFVILPSPSSRFWIFAAISGQRLASKVLSSFNITTALLGCDVVFDEKTAGYGPTVLHNIVFSAKAILT